MRIHNSSDRVQEFYPISYMQGRLKPHGIWYSPDFEWHNWCMAKELDFIGQYNYEIEIDETKILMVQKAEDILELIDKYGTEFLNIPVGAFRMSESRIDWDLVGRDYAGFEIRNYAAIKREFNHGVQIGDTILFLTWLYQLDVNSGCIWNVEAIKSIKIIQWQNQVN